MLNWTDGTGTARYWALKLIIDTLVTFEDSLYNTTIQAPSAPGSNPFCGSVLNLTPLTLTCSDPGAVINDLLFVSYGTPTGSCGTWKVG
jgi:hypothetical protein